MSVKTQQLEVPMRMIDWPKHIQQPEKDIKFSSNWNAKMYCHFFTTLRLDSNYYGVGEYYKIIKDNQFCFRGLVHIKKTLLRSQLTDLLCYQDTGYSLEETKKILDKFYPGKDWTTQKLNLILIENIEWNKP